MIFRYVVASGLAERDPCRYLRGALAPRIKSHFAALTTKEEAGEIMWRIQEYEGTFMVREVLLLSALTFCRPGPIRHAEWEEINWDEGLWSIPSAKMKLTKQMKTVKEPHIVPLSKQALDCLRRVQHLTGRNRYIFPNPRNRDLPMSENAVNMAIRRMGYTKEQMTAHGFRSMANTLLNESGYRSDIIEAHSDRNKHMVGRLSDGHFPQAY